MTNAAAPAAPLRLEYQPAADAPGAQQRRRGWRVASCAAMLPGLVVPFVPFACDQTPAIIVVWVPLEWLRGEPLSDILGIWLLSLPFLLALPILLWKLRSLLRPGVPSPSERVAGLALGAAAAAAVAGWMGMLWWSSLSDRDAAELVTLAVTTGGLLLVVGLFVRLTLGGRPDDRRAQVSVALLGPYVMTAAFCLFVWRDDAQVGWYLTLLPAAAALAELVAIGGAALRRRGRSP